MHSKRTFLALPLIPIEPAANKAKELKHLLRNYRIKWVDPESYHLTLFFFGEVLVDQLAALKDALRSAVDGISVFCEIFQISYRKSGIKSVRRIVF
jgi:2'-5' RNA ligase